MQIHDRFVGIIIRILETMTSKLSQNKAPLHTHSSVGRPLEVDCTNFASLLDLPSLFSFGATLGAVFAK